MRLLHLGHVFDTGPRAWANRMLLEFRFDFNAARPASDGGSEHVVVCFVCEEVQGWRPLCGSAENCTVFGGAVAGTAQRQAPKTVCLFVSLAVSLDRWRVYSCVQQGSRLEMLAASFFATGRPRVSEGGGLQELTGQFVCVQRHGLRKVLLPPCFCLDGRVGDFTNISHGSFPLPLVHEVGWLVTGLRQQNVRWVGLHKVPPCRLCFLAGT